LAYQQRVRDTGNPEYYVKSEHVLQEALRLAPKDLAATIALGSLALSRHRFEEALALGRRAVALSPSTARGYGVVGDALLELGRYPQAFGTFDRMVSLKPSLSAYARISYARELLGDIRGSVEALKLARDAAVGAPSTSAWARLQLGKLYWSHGRPRAAEQEYRAALAISPAFTEALDALAQREAGSGRLRQAIELERRAVELTPEPHHLIGLGDLYAAKGDLGHAKEVYRDVERAFRREAEAGARTDLELALFYADHGSRLQLALSLAFAGRAERPSVDGDDVLAWALIRNGRCGEALHYTRRALRLGTLDAAKFFHRGMAERCLGRRVAAKSSFRRALRLNPHFSVLWAPVARAAAR